MSTASPDAGGLFILSNMREYGGAEKSIATLIPHLADATWLRVFVENDQHFADLEKLRHPRLHLVRLPKTNLPHAVAWSMVLLLRHYWRERPRLLLANGHKGAVMLATLKMLLPWTRARFAVYIRDFGFYFLPWVLSGLRGARYFAPSQVVFDDERYIRWGLHEQHCEVITNAVEPARAEAVPAAPVFIGCCARLTPWKGIDYLIRAFHLVAAEHPEVRLHIYGEAIDTDYFAELEKLAADPASAGRVVFCSFVANPAEIYAGGALYVVSSLSDHPGPETFGRVVIEAWSYGKPVVAFATGGPLHLIEDGVDGFLVEEKNVGQLAERILRLLRDPARAAQMGAAGLKKAQEQYQPEAVARLLLQRMTA